MPLAMKVAIAFASWVQGRSPPSAPFDVRPCQGLLASVHAASRATLTLSVPTTALIKCATWTARVRVSDQLEQMALGYSLIVCVAIVVTNRTHFRDILAVRRIKGRFLALRDLQAISYIMEVRLDGEEFFGSCVGSTTTQGSDWKGQMTRLDSHLPVCSTHMQLPSSSRQTPPAKPPFW